MGQVVRGAGARPDRIAARVRTAIASEQAARSADRVVVAGPQAGEAGDAVVPPGISPRRRTPVKKPVRWSATIEKRFLAALVETLNVTASARIAKTSETSVYRHRQQSEAFRAAWALAVQEGYARLELLMLERAVKGVARPVFFGGRKIATVKEYSDRAALALLARRRGEGAGEALPIEDEATVRARMTQRLEEMAAQLAEVPGPDDGA